MVTVPPISVIIPTIDSLAQTRGAVQSALCQSVPVTEVVVVNDGERRPLDAAALGGGDARVRVVDLPKNRGAAAARQAGVETARGQLLAFLDADDRWLPGKLAHQLPLLQQAEAECDLVMVACGWIRGEESRASPRARIPIPSASVVDFASGCWYCPGSTLLVSRGVFAAIGPFDARLRRLEDLDWGLRFALGGGRLLVAPVLGARIEPSGRAGMVQILEAARFIEARYRSESRLTPRGFRHLRSYLALERAAAAWAAGAKFRAIGEFSYSLLMKPRLSLPLRRWWRS